MSKTPFEIRKSPVSKATVETSIDDRLRYHKDCIPVYCSRSV